jgi:hypothetical protein
VSVPEPLRAPHVEPPDRDYAAVREAAIAVVRAEAAPAWTDHNAPDPGITILEALAWSVADLHYRTAERGLGAWPLEVPADALPGEPHPSGVPLAPDPVAMLELAAAIARAGVADAMRAEIAGAGSSQAAATALAGHTFGSTADTFTPTWNQAAAAVRLLRAPVVLRGVLDGSAAVAAAVESSHGDDARALWLLRLEPVMGGLWDDELATLLRRHRRRELTARVRALHEEIAAATAIPALLTRLTATYGLTADEAELALALHPCPPGIDPELWERADGGTRVWPPHPLQSRTVEPISGEDYARRARAATGVRRAWAVRGEALPGVGWDGTPITTSQQRTGVVTLLVEPDTPVTPAQRTAFLKQVLRAVLGSTPSAEVDDPFQLWRDDLDPAAPRRTICDEVGAALLDTCEVTVKGTLYAPAGSDREALIGRARARVGAYFAAGRPETRPAAAAALACPQDIEGSWPAVPQPTDGWTPGDPIRLSELVQVLADDPLVLGMEGLQLAVGAGGWLPDPGITGEVPLPSNCVPVLAERKCLGVTLTLASECGRG